LSYAGKCSVSPESHAWGLDDVLNTLSR